MICSLKTAEEYIYAYIEFEIVGADGRQDEKGQYIYISDLWVQPYYRSQHLRVIRELSRMVDRHELAQGTQWVYWEREKYNNRLSKVFLRKKLASKGVADENIQDTVPMFI